MCGIVGYVGKDRAVDFLLDGLKKLEYRGYDSAGVATVCKNALCVRKKVGKVSALVPEAQTLLGNVGIGHTRWATHGKPSDANAHPIVCGNVAVVHNGIVENYRELADALKEEGRTFVSQTDTEVIAQLINKFYRGNLVEAVQKATEKIKGSFALAVLCSDFPDRIVVARKNSPLIVGVGKDCNYVASDVPAIADKTNEVYILKDGDFAEVTASGVTFFDGAVAYTKQPVKPDMSLSVADLGDFDSFMVKEIHEIPSTLKKTFKRFYSCCDLEQFRAVAPDVEKIQIVACGTAYHSGVYAKNLIEKLARISVEVIFSGEYATSEPIADGKTLVVAVSQSGETADTLAALKRAKACGAMTMAITNTPNSTLCALADMVFFTEAGVEIAVAATKSYNTQLEVWCLLACELAQSRNVDCAQLKESVRALPSLAEKMLLCEQDVKELAQKYAAWSNVYYIGRGFDFSTVLEGSLKLKEIAYVHSGGYAASELKHGTIALVDDSTLIVAVATQKELSGKMQNAVCEVKARNATVWLVSPFSLDSCDEATTLPPCDERLAPLLAVIPLQLFAYYVTVARGNDPDKPRNLAKSVTVE